jgi:hypothetical protein
MTRKFGRQLRETVCNANRIKALDRSTIIIMSLNSVRKYARVRKTHYVEPLNRNRDAVEQEGRLSWV